MKTFGLATFVLVLSSCTSFTQSWDKADKVQVTDKVSTYACKFIDVVVGGSESDANDTEYLFEAAMRKARDNAANRDATHVILQGTPQSQFDPEARLFHMTVVVNAYHCKP
jgi:hypothetical protein